MCSSVSLLSSHYLVLREGLGGTDPGAGQANSASLLAPGCLGPHLPPLVPSPPSPKPLTPLPLLTRLQKPHTCHSERPSVRKDALEQGKGSLAGVLGLGGFLYSEDTSKLRECLHWPVSRPVEWLLLPVPTPSWGRIKQPRGQKSGLFVKETMEQEEKV